MRTLPTGTVTYLMTDVEGSARLWESDSSSMSEAMRRHDELALEAAEAHCGHLLKERGEGDSLFIVFADPVHAVRAATDFQLALQREPWPRGIELRVRCAIHTGVSEVRGSDYYGPAVNRCARLRSIANGGQILISQAAQQLLPPQMGAITIRDLGTHRLRDLLRPERVGEIVHPELRPVPATLGSLNRVLHNLPVQLTSFVGRQNEVLRIRSMLQAARLITLTGAGGCGKTRLALQIGAESCDEFAEGVWFVDLTRVEPGGDCAVAVAKTLALPASANAIEALVAGLRDRRVLLILDNCEHVTPGIAPLVAQLLAECNGVHLLCTSREPLRVQGEVRRKVPSLSLPRPKAGIDEIRESEAVRLFVDRAEQRDPEFSLHPRNAEAVADLVRLLDGIPLAIEQAASHASVLNPQQMVRRFKDRLRDLGTDDYGVVPRHRTLRATMEWSYDMLPEPQQLLLQRCTTFVGGWSLEAAEAVCADDRLPTDHIAEALRALVDKSMVFVEEGLADRRFRMLQIVREFASDLMADRDVWRAAHARYFVEYARRNTRPEDSSWAAIDHENLMLAAQWLLSREPTKALPFLLDLRFYLVRYPHPREGATLLEQALPAGQDPTDRARGLNTLGALRWRYGDLSGADVAYRESLSLWTELGDRAQQAAVLHNTSFVNVARSELSSARETLEQAIAIYRELGDSRGLAASLLNLGRIHLDLGEYEASVSVSEEAIRLLSRLGDAPRAVKARVNQATGLALLGRDGEAVRLIEQCLRQWQETPDTSSMTSALVSLAWMANKRALLDEAQQLAHCAVSFDEGVLDPVDKRMLREVGTTAGEWQAEADPALAVQLGLNICNRLTSAKAC